MDKRHAILILMLGLPGSLAAEAQWKGHGGDPQHTALSGTASLSIAGIRWSTPVDETMPTEPILIHYGSPVITQANTVLVPVRATSGQ